MTTLADRDLTEAERAELSGHVQIGLYDRQQFAAAWGRAILDPTTAEARSLLGLWRQIVELPTNRADCYACGKHLTDSEQVYGALLLHRVVDPTIAIGGLICRRCHKMPPPRLKAAIMKTTAEVWPDIREIPVHAPGNA